MPQADILYACDNVWWKKYDGVPTFQGLKLSPDARVDGKTWGIERVMINRKEDSLLFAQRGLVGWGGNSGFQTINLAAQMGVSKIILIGYDMSIERGTHWHGNHPAGMNNPTAPNVARWRRAIDAAAWLLNLYGVEVINTSMESALVNYPKMSLAEALAK